MERDRNMIGGIIKSMLHIYPYEVVKDVIKLLIEYDNRVVDVINNNLKYKEELVKVVRVISNCSKKFINVVIELLIKDEFSKENIKQLVIKLKDNRLVNIDFKDNVNYSVEEKYFNILQFSVGCRDNISMLASTAVNTRKDIIIEQLEEILEPNEVIVGLNKLEKHNNGNDFKVVLKYDTVTGNCKNILNVVVVFKLNSDGSISGIKDVYVSKNSNK
jgi:hypothetical protein